MTQQPTSRADLPDFLSRRENLPAKVGLFSIGLEAYWAQFPGLKEQLLAHNNALQKQMESFGCEVFSCGVIDNAKAGRAAGDFFAEKNVDLIFCNVSTYCTSSVVLPAVQRRKVPVIVLSLQPHPSWDYVNTDTSTWLAGDVGCCVPEISCVFNRARIPFHVISGLLYDDERTTNEIRSWIQAASVARTIYYGRLGFLGNTYPGMLDLCSDFTMHQAQLGSHVEILEMCDLKKRVDGVSDKEIEERVSFTREMFNVTDASSADPIANPPTEEQLRWSAKVARGLELLFQDLELTTLAYYYRGLDDNEYERIGAGLILGNTFLTSSGYPCATEGDLKTTVAMLILDSLGAGGSFCEIAALDFEEDFMLMGHDGPGHIAITGHKPILRGLGLYHGKRGSGVSVEFNVKHGPITLLGMTQTADGNLKMVAAEGEAIPGEIFHLGNCLTRVVFPMKPYEFLEAWSGEGPTHHCALGIGHHLSTIRKLSSVIGVELSVVSGGPREGLETPR